jgi:cell division protein FtsZ
MMEMGDALMGTGEAAGEDRAAAAAHMAISSPLLENVSIAGARGVLINVTGGPDMTLFDVNDATSKIYDAAGADANIIVGAVIDKKLKDTVRVTVIATGFGSGTSQETVVEEPKREERPRDLFGEVVKPEPVLRKAPSNGGNGGKKKELVYTSTGNLEVPTYIRRQMQELEDDFSGGKAPDDFAF